MGEEIIIDKLKEIGKTHNRDVVEKVAQINGEPIYRLRNSKIPLNAKTGYPHLYSIKSNGDIYELNVDEIHQVLAFVKISDYRQ